MTLSYFLVLIALLVGKEHFDIQPQGQDLCIQVTCSHNQYSIIGYF